MNKDKPRIIDFSDPRTLTPDLKISGGVMSKADEAFNAVIEQEFVSGFDPALDEAFKSYFRNRIFVETVQHYSFDLTAARNFFAAGYRARGVADMETVEAARKSVAQDGIEMIPSALYNEIEDRINALDEGGGDESA